MLEIDGKFYSRVSSILKPLCNFKGIPKHVLENKASIGTRVHEAIKQCVDGQAPVALVEVADKGYFHSFEKWRDYFDPVFLESERRYCCDEKRFTGAIDAIVKLKGKEKAVLVDFKTSAQESPIVWPRQGHFYYYLASKTLKELDDRVLFIQLHKDGSMPTIFEYKIKEIIMKECLQRAEDHWKVDFVP